MNAKSFVIASAAAALFIAGGSGIAGAEHHEEAKVKCEGANECKGQRDRKSTRLNSSHSQQSRMPSSA